MPSDRKIQRYFDPLSLDFCKEDISSIVEEALQPQQLEKGPKFIFTANLDHIVQLSLNEEFRRAYASASIITIDGWPVAAAKRIASGAAYPCVPGADLYCLMARCLCPERHRLFYVVSDHETGAMLVEFHLRRGFTRNEVAFEVPPYGFESDRSASIKLERKIRENYPTHVFFGVGAPKSEIWSVQHAECLKNAVVLCCGAGLSFFVGTNKRAPRIWRKLKLEWLWRLKQEPKRLFGRYSKGAFLFTKIFLRHWASASKYS